MQTGNRFWYLISIVAMILVIYGLLNLQDAIGAQQKQLDTQISLLQKQKKMLAGNEWIKNLKQAETAQKQWRSYLPAEKNITYAKAKLISDFRNLALDSGMTGISVNANEQDGNEKTALASIGKESGGNTLTRKDSKADALPDNVQMLKLSLTGRFDPIAFNKLIKRLDDANRFIVIEKVSAKGAQLEIGVRCYWQTETASDTANAPILPKKES